MPDSAVQLPLEFKIYNNQSLFSDHYLDKILQRDAAWRQAVTEGTKFLEWLRSKHEEEKDQLPHYKEAQLEDNWFKPIFDRLGHVWEGQAAIPGLKGSTKKPDFAFFVDEAARKQAVALQNSTDYADAAIAVGEVKQWEINLSKKTGKQPTFDDQNPMFQIDTYLTLTGLDWGILSNGRYWRLVNRGSSRTLETYFEIDLLAALHAPDETKAKAVAAYFWLFFNQASFRPDAQGKIFLNEAISQSRAYAVALEADLRDNAYRSLEQLIIGFFEGDQTLNKDDVADRNLVYKNSLYLLYRLLFLFYGESRGMLPMHNQRYKEDYSLQQLAKYIDNNRNGIGSMPVTGRRHWHRLGELFRLISGIDAQLNADLNVPRYNGGLFDPEQHPFLENHFVGDRALATAIDYLAVRRITKAGGLPEFQTVDYSTLDVRQLGSIYEGLLEYKVVVAEEEMVTISKKGVETWIPTKQKGKAKKIGNQRYPGDLYLTTDKGERKATGSYYTPDYIVEYIVDNTLDPLVKEAREQVKAQVRKTGTLDDEERKRQSAVLFVTNILQLNVLDPAMGSGHFLVEATNYLARALATDEYVQVESEATASPEKAGGATAETDLLYWKRRVVEACIYGVDKNPMAVELAKLSLWLKTASADKPLSFLDHHLRHGDSLIGAWLKDLQAAPGRQTKTKADDGQAVLFDEVAFTVDASLAVQGVTGIEDLPTLDIEDVHTKEAAWHNIQETHIARWRQLADLWVSYYFGNTYTAEEYRALVARIERKDSLMSDVQVKQFLSHSAITDNDYFHWELAFPEVFFDEYGRSLNNAAGFDAVIGNPPYVRMEEFKHIKDYLRQSFVVHETRTDIYTYFIEQAVNLLAENHCLGFIVSNKWLRSNYGSPLRKLLLSQTSIKQMIDFGDLPVFDVTAYPLILVTGKGPIAHNNNIKVATISDLYFDELGELVNTIAEYLPQEQLTNTEWNLQGVKASTLLSKLQAQNPSLKDYIGGSSQMGVKTGRNDAFIIDLETRTNLINIEPEAEEIIYPVCMGNNIRRYSLEWEKQFLIYTYHGIDISRFPAVENYLRTYKSQLEKRATKQNWYELQQPQEAYRSQFLQTKIMMPDLAERGRFCLDRTGVFTTNTGYFLPIDDLFLLALLNSRLTTFCLENTSATFRGGYLRLFGQYVERLPVCEIRFVTSSGERTTTVNAAKTQYEQNNQSVLLAWADAELASNRNDTIHDLLAFLAEQMIATNKEKQAALEAFWLDLEGVTDNKTFDTLRNKAKWEQSLYKNVPASRPYVDENSRSSVGLDASLSWNEEAYKGFIKELVGSVSGLSKLVQVYREHAPLVANLDERLRVTDHLIDQIVYKLYGLTDEEIAIVEGEG